MLDLGFAVGMGKWSSYSDCVDDGMWWTGGVDGTSARLGRSGII